jgi:hypothetical protein
MIRKTYLLLFALLIGMAGGASAEILIYYPMDQGQGSTVVNAVNPGIMDGTLTGSWSGGGKFDGGVTSGSGAGVTAPTGALPNQMTMMMWVNGSAGGYAGVFSAGNVNDGRISIEESTIEICPDAGGVPELVGLYQRDVAALGHNTFGRHLGVVSKRRQPGRQERRR